MIELMLIGMGTGDVEHLTLQAVRVLKGADLVLIPRKGADRSDLLDVRRAICAKFLERRDHLVEFDLPVRDATGNYLDGVADWHDAIADIWASLIQDHMAQAAGLSQGGVSGDVAPVALQRVALLVWGDPSLYDSTLRIAARLQSRGVIGRTTVVPGLTSLQLLTAAHGIPLNTVGGAVHLTTGRRIRDEGWPAGLDSVAVFLDGECSFQTLPAQDLYIYWGAYLGLPQEVCIAGKISEVADQIVTVRAKARAQHGWIMDVYLIRRDSHAGAPNGV